MWWDKKENPSPKDEPPNPQSQSQPKTGTSPEFEKAAERVAPSPDSEVSPPPDSVAEPEPEIPAQPGRAGPWLRVKAWLGSKLALTEHEKSLVEFQIEPDWAREAVKLTFFPFEYADPLWALTDEEAEKARPAMQDLMQAVADRYVPDSLGYIKAKHPELFAFLLAYGLLIWQKNRQIIQVRASRSVQSDVSQMPEPGSSQGIMCEVCERTFPGDLALAGHLPCPGKAA